MASLVIDPGNYVVKTDDADLACLENSLDRMRLGHLNGFWINASSGNVSRRGEPINSAGPAKIFVGAGSIVTFLYDAIPEPPQEKLSHVPQTPPPPVGMVLNPPSRRSRQNPN